MRELGEDSKELHTEIAEKILASSVHSLVLVGEEMKRFVYPLIVEAWGEERVFTFLHSRLA